MRNDPDTARPARSLISALAVAVILCGGVIFRSMSFGGAQPGERASAAIRAAEVSGMASPSASRLLEKAETWTGKAIALRPLHLQSWLLSARIALIQSRLGSSSPEKTRLAEKIGMAYLSGRHAILPSARHRLETALWSRHLFKEIPVPESGVLADVGTLSRAWKIEQLATIAKKTGSGDLVRAGIPEGTRRHAAFDYYLVKKNRP